MTSAHEIPCTAFAGQTLLASGPLAEVAAAVWDYLPGGGEEPVLVFDDRTGRRVDLDLRSGRDEAIRAAQALTPSPGEAQPARRPGPGRPSLGVVAREVTLLPRHWAWLSAQRGGASAALRRLVDEARRSGVGEDRVRAAQDAAYRFLSYVGGDLPGYEEAIRALYRRERERFHAETEGWPEDFREHGRRLAEPAFEASREGPAAAEPRPPGAPSATTRRRTPG